MIIPFPDAVFLLQEHPPQARTALRLLKLLEYKIALAIVVIKVVRVFYQASAFVVLSVVAVGRFKEVADGVGGAVFKIHRPRVVDNMVVIPVTRKKR
jgi:hypothetical protein